MPFPATAASRPSGENQARPAEAQVAAASSEAARLRAGRSFRRWWASGLAALMSCAFGLLMPTAAAAQSITLAPMLYRVAGVGLYCDSRNPSPGTTLICNQGDGGPALEAMLDWRGAVSVDRAGNVYFAESDNGTVRKVNPRGIISTIAGNGNPDISQASYGDGGLATGVALFYPLAVAVDPAGNVLVSEAENCDVRKVDTNGLISTLVGGPKPGYSCGLGPSDGDGGPANQAGISQVIGMAYDTAGRLYLSDGKWLVVRRVDADGSIHTAAGNHDLSCPSITNFHPFCNGGFGGDGGPATQAGLVELTGMATSGASTFYVADVYHNRIRKVDSRGIITTVAGNDNLGFGGDGGPATEAAIHLRTGGIAAEASIATDSQGNLYFADTGNHRIRRVDTNGIITTVVGNGLDGQLGDNGFAAFQAEIAHPTGLAVDTAGNLYFRDLGVIEKVSWPTAIDDFGVVNVGRQSSTRFVYLVINSASTLASVESGAEFAVTSNSCALSTPLAAGTVCTLEMSFSPAVAGRRVSSLRLADDKGRRFSFPLGGTGAGSMVSFTPGILSTVAGTGVQGYSGDGGPAVAANLFAPYGIKFDGSGNLFITDYGACRIRKVDSVGTITTVAGNGECSFHGDGRPSGDGGPATSAALGSPYGVALDAVGNLFIVDFENHRVRKVDTGGTITTIAGTGNQGFGGDGGPATQAQLFYPVDVAVDQSGNLFIADVNNERIRKVDSKGVISTVAGNGVEAPGGDGIPATDSPLYIAEAVNVDDAGNLLIGESAGQRVRKVDPQGLITTLAGNGIYSGTQVDDKVPATQAALGYPSGVAADVLGNVYIANYGGNRISKVDANGILTNIAGNGQPGFSADGGPATASTVYYPWSVAPDDKGNLYFSEVLGRRIRKLDTTTAALSFVTSPPAYVGTTGSPQSVRLNNAGNAPLDFQLFAWPTGFQPAAVGDDCAVGTPLAAGASCNIGVGFAPQSPGSLVSGDLLVFDSAVNSPQTVHLSGNAQALPPPASVLNVEVLYGGASYSLIASTRNRLPWQIRGLRITFSQPIASGNAASLGGLPATGLVGLGTDTLTWSLTPLTIGDFSATLVTAGSDALRDAFGTAVAPMAAALRVLYGDANDDGVVSAADMVYVSNARALPFNPFANLNGDEVIDLLDVQVVRSRIGTRLP